MSTKVEQVVKAILDSPDEILHTYREANEFYFRFRGHTFSIQECEPSSNSFDREAGYSFYVYPQWTSSPQSLPFAEARGEHGTDSVAYREGEFEESLLQQLHREAMSRCFKVDAVFDDVLGDAGA